MKLDMGQAWTNATAMLGGNRDLILAVAGLFFFLPYLVVAIFFPEAINPPPPPPPSDPSDMQAVIDSSLGALTQQYRDYWWAFLGLTLIQTIGTLALLTLLTDTNRPTVGEAIKLGLRGLLPYLGALILMVLGISIAVGVPLGLLSAIGLGIVAVLIAIPLVIYLAVKFSLYTAVIAIEREYNPIAALKRSWQLTKGNSLRLFFFLLLLFIALGVASLVISLVMGTIFAALGGTVEMVGLGFVSSLINAVMATIFLSVFAAVHRQLSGSAADTGKGVADVFE